MLRDKPTKQHPASVTDVHPIMGRDGERSGPGGSGPACFGRESMGHDRARARERAPQPSHGGVDAVPAQLTIRSHPGRTYGNSVPPRYSHVTHALSDHLLPG